MKKITSLLLSLIFLLLSNANILAQQYDRYHVGIDSTVIFDTTSTSSAGIITLAKHSNVRVMPYESNTWIKINYRNEIGYGKIADFTKGWAMMNTYTYKAAAICKDGNSINIPDSNPDPKETVCKDNEGFQDWEYKTEQTIKIIE